jgi:hypothetical protein
MTHVIASVFQRTRRCGFIALSFFLVAGFAGPSFAEGPIVQRGDAAVTGFSGAKTLPNVPDGVSPTDMTFIDTGGAVLRVFDLTRLGGPPTGALVNAPSTFEVNAGQIGQVFGVALDSETANRLPNVYVTATSLFGLQIIAKDGRRLVNGERGARWMPGQFGTLAGGGPGSVWKIDGRTGKASLFASLAYNDKDNAGPGLGAIAYDSASEQLFVTDLEFGLIHRLGLDGSVRGSFDHGTSGRPNADLEPIAYDAARRMGIERPEFNVEEPSTWGFADARRRVFAVTVDDGRVYYSVAKPAQVWSVGLTADGGFADDARIEFDVEDMPGDNFVSEILFDGPGQLFLSQRGGLTGSYDYSIFAKLEKPVVRRYVWSEGDKKWSEEVGEFAVGFKTPHRSTLGGIAFNYGYFADGKIDYGKCRATLWTTGEHLRESDDKKRDLKGGARIVHGLQATDKGNIRPLNAPPLETWFVDNDGQFDDADLYSRIGDIAIYDPCDTPTVAKPALPVSPEPVPPPQAGIWIKKICLPAPFGGPIHCIITVTNSSAAVPDAPVTIWDAASILSGPGEGFPVTISNVAPDIPQWLCSAVPTNNLSCMLPPALLPPGTSHFIDVTVDTAPLLAGGNHGFRNCAVLGAPWHGQACAEGGTQLTIVKTAPAACALGADCTFGITVTNTGSLPFSGDIVLSDSMFMGGGVALPAPIAIAPPFGCAPAPAAVPFSCTAPLNLAAGASHAFSITATMPAGPLPGYWARNCVAISAPGVPPPALPPAIPGDGNVSCAWVPLNNLRLSKEALHAGKCFKAPGNTILCDYEISVTNDGPSPYSGMLSLDEKVPAAATLTVTDANWNCAGGPPTYACNTLAPVDIAVAASLKLPLQVSIPLAPLDAAGCSLPNTASLTAPVGGSAANFNAADDSDTAVADAFLSWVDIFGVLQVTCDPTNLKTTKVSKGDCVVAGTGFRCDYTVALINTGPDPYHGPLKVNEELGFEPTSVSFSAPWGCAGGGSSFLCTNPHVDMEKGDSVELKVSVDVPDDGQCELINRATTVFPVPGTRYNNGLGDDFAAAIAKIPSKRCEKPQRPQCDPDPNEMRSESGACVCKTGFIRAAGRQCVGIVEPELCPDGSPMPKSGRCVKDEPPLCQPGPNEVRNDGKCVCKRGYERDKNGRCVKDEPPLCQPGPNEVRDDGKCVCKRCFERDKNGRCVKEEPPLCQPGPNEVRDDGKCVCKRGFERDKNGRCVTGGSDRAEECRKKGWLWTGKRCVEPPTKPCPKGTVGTPPNCKAIETPRCPTGFTGTPPNCKPVDKPKCPRGTIGTPPNCKPIPKPKCPTGMVGTPPNCRSIVKPKCPSGTTGTFPNCKSAVPRLKESRAAPVVIKNFKAPRK